MRWATRGGVHVDRAGCAWLIRRFIDPDAGFSFVDDSADVAQDAILFDMPGVELAHHGPDCTFETMLKRYQLHDPVLSAIAEVVHEADLEDDRFDAPAAPGLNIIIRGLSLTLDDQAVLDLTANIFDGLYEYLRKGLILGREPA